jgi:ABC-type uncharacterized transport system substrate-binding protein
MKEVRSLCSGVGKSIFHIALWTLLFASCAVAEAQQTVKVYRIGYLSNSQGLEFREEAFRHALQELGYTEGKNLVIEWRFAKGSVRLRPQLVEELVRLKVDCIVATGSGETAIAQKATSTIPIVMMSSTDPVGTRFVASLAQPGGNITGLTSISGDLGGKVLELLKEIVPALSRVVAAEPAGGISQDLFFKETDAPARALGIKLPIAGLKISRRYFEPQPESGLRGFSAGYRPPLRRPNVNNSLISQPRIGCRLFTSKHYGRTPAV